MSRNKDIKFLHDTFGWSYKDCRAKLKKAHWKLELIPWIATRSNLDQLCRAFNNLKPAIANACDVIGSALCFFADALRETKGDDL